MHCLSKKVVLCFEKVLEACTLCVPRPSLTIPKKKEILADLIDFGIKLGIAVSEFNSGRA